MKELYIYMFDNCAFCEIPGSWTVYGKTCDEVVDVLNKAAELKMFGLVKVDAINRKDPYKELKYNR